ncbi:MAG: GNAT family N-acetyltransferase [Nitrososphaerota archaeon]
MVGKCSFHHFDPGFHRAKTGWALTLVYWRQGIMAEAMAAILTYRRTDLGVHRAEAIIDIENEPSKNLLLKLGLRAFRNLRGRVGCLCAWIAPAPRRRPMAPTRLLAHAPVSPPSYISSERDAGSTSRLKCPQELVQPKY